MQLLAQNIVGGLYALIALGFSLIYRTIGLVKFAQGNLLMFGTYLGLTFYLGLLHAGRVPAVMSSFIGVALCALIGVGLERVFRPIAKLDLSYNLLGTIGVGITLDSLASRKWGSEGHSVPSPIPTEMVTVLGLRILPYDLVIIAITVLLGVALQGFLFRTNLGCGLRAAAGLRHADVGDALGIKGFVAAIIGGLGDLPGAVVGGLLYGLIETIASGYISSQYTGLIAYSLLVVVLIVRPEGLLGARTVEKV